MAVVDIICYQMACCQTLPTTSKSLVRHYLQLARLLSEFTYDNEYIKYRLTQPCFIKIKNRMTTIVSASQGHHQVMV
jgi:hypothetical protein